MATPNPDSTTLDAEILAELRRINEQLKSSGREEKKHRDRANQKSGEIISTGRAIEYAIAIALTMGVYVYNTTFSPQAGGLALGELSNSAFVKPVQEGDNISGYVVTSGFGQREAPIEGASTDHKGVDLGTPVGTTIYMIGDRGSVECKSDPDGYGTYAEIKPQISGANYTFLAGHLSNCASGEFNAGEIIAKTGNSGNSSGAHLHWGQYQGDQTIAPQTGYLVWAITGSKPKQEVRDLATGGLSSGIVGELQQRIIGQESGGNHQAVNSDSGASGLYQIMPENIEAWSQECLGQSVGQDEFLSDPNLQSEIAGCKLSQYFDAAIARGESNYEACRSVAAAWYSGDPDLKNSMAPQGGYPSIQSYTQSVCKGFQ